MKRTVAIGIQDFETLRTGNWFYIDKTDFIRRWWNQEDSVTLITRPRRFGKTLNLSMLNCFFSNKYENRSDLFEGLDVWKDKAIRKEQGIWPVIFLSFAGIKFTTIAKTVTAMNQLIADEYNRYAWMIQEPQFTDEDRAFFKKVRSDMPDEVAAVSLKLLCRGKQALRFHLPGGFHHRRIFLPLCHAAGEKSGAGAEADGETGGNGY